MKTAGIIDKVIGDLLVKYGVGTVLKAIVFVLKEREDKKDRKLGSRLQEALEEYQEKD